MLHLLKKLKLYTKLVPETEHKAPISIQIKIYLWSFVDYQHMEKYFYNWNITLNYCFIYKINIRGNFIWKCPCYVAYSRNLGQHLILARKSTFFEKRAPKSLPLPLIQSLFYMFCIEIKLCIIFAKGGNVQ